MVSRPSPLPDIPVAPGTKVPLPRAYERLWDLAYNMWWVWHRPARELWQRVSLPHWQATLNPLSMLQAVPGEVWETLEANDSFADLYHEVISAFDQYLAAEDTWYSRTHPGSLPNGLAYLCTEFGVHHTLPFYAGGLGVLAGDHAKAASDLGVPMVAVGLLYRLGYFHQEVDPEGTQQHLYRSVEVTRRALRRVLDRTGHPLVVQVELPGRMVDVGAWRIDVGRVPLLLLDTNLPSNDPADRPITQILYVRGREMRLCQELVLGIGGARVIDALGWKPSTWHINEGHAAFALLQRLSRALGSGATFEEARRQVREHTLFTLHTPLPAGNETFDLGLVQHYLADRLHGIDAAVLADLGDNGHPGVFDMGSLAIRLAAVTNGVSQRHGEVVTRDWQHLIGRPAEAVTNGVHLPTWVGGVIERRFAKVLGQDWAQHTLEPAAWDALRAIPDKELWEAHQAQKQRLLRQVRSRLREQEARHGEAPDELRRVGALFDLDYVTLVFARRFAAYKRVGLLLTDVDRLRGLLAHPERPVQIVFGGKAHPADREGQDLIRRVVQMAKDPRFEGHIAYVEDYDMELARYLLAGADVWVNMPRPPMEASGTSGMKAAINGAPNLSVLDGWWLEGFQGNNGWGFGETTQGDQADAAALYDLIEHRVVPLYYDRDAEGIPRGWVAMMKEAMIAAVPFSATRMVAEYMERLYLRANGNGEASPG
ncbi:MAG: glycosyltransferase family 1 protein [Actinobacteria bacterium]|nr:glycosyltransferase family 1 protein [Actinomycetota bacterium]